MIDGGRHGNSSSRPLLDNGRWTIKAAAQRQADIKKTTSTSYRFDCKYTNDERQRIVNGDGPFVFGVHTPSQFPIRSRFEDEDAEQRRRAPESVIDYDDDDVESSNNLFCDKRIRKNGGVREPKLFAANRDIKNIKCVLVGDGCVGKTTLITSYAQNLFQYDYKPTTFDKYDVKVEVDTKPICIQICDTSGQDYLESVRELCYPGSDVIMLCFSVVKPESFRSIASRWVPAVSSVKAPYVLVGTQCDLRDNYGIINDLRLQGESPVSETEAKVLASTLHAPYVETSSKMRYRLKDAFDSAILAALPVKKKRSVWKKLCCLP